MMVFLEAPRVAWGVLGSSRGVLEGSMAPFLEPWGSLGVHLGPLEGHLGVLGGPWGPPSFPMVAQGRHRVPFWLLMVRLWCYFWSILGAKIVKFSCYFLASFLDAFVEASGCIFGVILVVVGRYVLVLFPTL